VQAASHVLGARPPQLETLSVGCTTTRSTLAARRAAIARLDTVTACWCSRHLRRDACNLV